MFCKHCGYENDDDATFCEKCGANLSGKYSQKSSASMSTKNKILIVAVIILVAIIGILAGTLLQTNNTPLNNTTQKNSSNQTANPPDVENNTNSNLGEIETYPTVNKHGQAYTVPNPSGFKLVCPNCGSNNIGTLDETDTHTKWQCQYCGYQWWEPIPADLL